LGTARAVTRDEEEKLDSQELARMLVDMLEERQASDILLMDVRRVTILADYFIICSANSERQLGALERELPRQLKADLGRPLSVEGEPESGWILIDYGDVIVHLFLPEIRRFYDLEGLWQDAQTIVHIQ
jgi:ribosome-associated protein